MATIFRIRDKDTGLFSSGGQHPTFDKKGKAWTNIGHVKNHLIEVGRCTGTWIPKTDGTAIPNNWEIVEYEVIEAMKHKESAREVYEYGRRCREAKHENRRRW